MDALLDDPAFFAPFVPFFDPRIGRPSTPMEYRLGYEALCRQVSDSVTWRRFWIALDGSVPHPTTAQRCRDSTKPCWRRPRRRRCCAPTGLVRTPRWCRRTWPTRPIRGRWPRAIRRIAAELRSRRQLGRDEVKDGVAR